MQTILLLLFAMTVNAALLTIPSDVSQVVSADGPYEEKYSNATRNRFIVRNVLGGEGPQSILIEKFAPGRYGQEDRVIQSKVIEVPSLPKVKEYIKAKANKSAESTYGCCSVSEIVWATSEWTFLVGKGDKKFKCRIADIDAKDPKISCAE